MKVSKAMKRRIQRTSKEVQMVKISTSAEGKRSVFVPYIWHAACIYGIVICKSLVLEKNLQGDLSKKQSKNPTSSAKYKLALGTNLPRSGSTYLKRSAAYPKQFGKAVLKHHTKYLDSWFWMDSRPPVLGANVDDPTILLFF